MPLHVSSIYAHQQEVKIAFHSLCYHLTYRWLSRAQVERRLYIYIYIYIYILLTVAYGFKLD